MSPLRETFARTAVYATTLGTSLALATAARAGQVTIGWDPNPEPDIAGYNVYYGISGSGVTNTVSPGNITKQKITSLEDGEPYWFYVTAFNTSGLESDPSDVINYTTPAASGPTTYTSEGDIIVANTESGNAVIYGGSGNDWIGATTNMMIFYARGQGGRDDIYTSANPLSYNNVDGGAHNDFLRANGGRNSLTGGANTDIFSYGWDSLLYGNAQAITDFNLTDEPDYMTTDPVGLALRGDTILIGCVLADNWNANPDISRFVRIVPSGNDAVLRIKPDGTGPAGDFNFIRLSGFATNNPGMIHPLSGEPITAALLEREGNLMVAPEPEP